MDLTPDQRDILYKIIWQEPATQGKNPWTTWVAGAATQPFVDAGLVEVKNGKFVGTEKGRAALSPMARTACQRPQNYLDLPERRQWEIDSNLGILDWDGK